jgi:hypothetical protein
MKRIVLITAAVVAGCVAAAAAPRAAPFERALQQVYAGTQTQQPFLVPVRGYRHHGWRRHHFGSLLMWPPALAALVFRPYFPAPRHSYREAVAPEPVAPATDEAASPAPAPGGPSAPWVDPDEPAH